MPTPRSKGRGYTNIPNKLTDGGYMGMAGASAFCVYLVYRRLRRKDGTADPGVTYVQTATGFGRETVTDSLRKLRDTGWLRCDHVGRSVNDPSVYYVPIVEDGELVGKADQSEKPTSRNMAVELVGKADSTSTVPVQDTLSLPPAHTPARTGADHLADLCTALPPFIPNSLREHSDEIVEYWRTVLAYDTDRIGRNISAPTLQANMVKWAAYPFDRIKAGMDDHIQACSLGTKITQPATNVTGFLAGKLPHAKDNGKRPGMAAPSEKPTGREPADAKIREEKF